MINITGPDDKTERIKDVEVVIKDFDKWFQEVMKNEPLSRPESAILRTFLHYATKPSS